MKDNARWGRGGFLGFGMGGVLSLTDQAIEFHEGSADESAQPTVAIPLNEVVRVERDGWILRFPIWLHIILVPLPLVCQGLMAVVSLFIKPWLLIRTSGRPEPFALSPSERSKVWIEGINEKQRTFASLATEQSVAVSSSQVPQVAPTRSPSPPPAAAEKLRQLKGLLDEGLISPGDFETKKAELLRAL